MLPAVVIDRLRTFCRSGNHSFWADNVSLQDETLFNLAHVAGARQLTDIYLLGLAAKMGGRLATFDRAIPLNAVVGATPALVEIVGA
jgi:predicted nucleic acid-binding protein